MCAIFKSIQVEYSTAMTAKIYTIRTSLSEVLYRELVRLAKEIEKSIRCEAMFSIVTWPDHLVAVQSTHDAIHNANIPVDRIEEVRREVERSRDTIREKLIEKALDIILYAGLLEYALRSYGYAKKLQPLGGEIAATARRFLDMVNDVIEQVLDEREREIVESIVYDGVDEITLSERRSVSWYCPACMTMHGVVVEAVLRLHNVSRYINHIVNELARHDFAFKTL